MDFFKKRICIIEDNWEVNQGYALIVNSIKEYAVINTYLNCEDAIANLKKDSPDVVLMDLDLPGMNGIEGIKEMKKHNSEIEFVVITIYEDSELVFKALEAGASGYLTKSANYVELVGAIEEVLKGGSPMSTTIARMVVQSFRRNPNSPLTKRETEVLNLIAEGKSYSLISEDLNISKETTKSHIKNIYAKLHVSSKAEALYKARHHKLI